MGWGRGIVLWLEIRSDAFWGQLIQEKLCHFCSVFVLLLCKFVEVCLNNCTVIIINIQRFQ